MSTVAVTTVDLARVQFATTSLDAASSHYALAVMTVVALILVPVVLLYQGWTYYVFRHRVSGDAAG